MSVYYSTNWMGPINMDWIKKNGSHWAGGRIDMWGDGLGPFGDEVSVPIIHIEDWRLLSDWLEGYVTEKPDYDVLKTFENGALGRPLRVWKSKEDT